jgi:thiol-disulfide isomerase/thioredoxin
MAAPFTCTRRAAMLAAGTATGLAMIGLHAQTPPPGEERAGPPPPIGQRIDLPDLSLLDGSMLRAADTEGQVVVLYWWASWCPFCAVQTPLMDKLWQAQRARGLRLVGLSIDRKPEDASTYLARRGYAFPSAWVTPAIRQVLPKAKGLPITVVLGRDRRVVMSEAGQLFPEDIEAIARFL